LTLESLPFENISKDFLLGVFFLENAGELRFIMLRR
jgi:hypothetical protein